MDARTHFCDANHNRDLRSGGLSVCFFFRSNLRILQNVWGETAKSMSEFNVCHSVLDAKRNSKLRFGGSLWVVLFLFGLAFWAFKSVHFADANLDSRLAILLGSPGAPRWSSAILNHDSSLAIWTAQTVILQMLITIVA